MRIKWLLVSGLFGVGILLLPFTYAQILDNEKTTYAVSINVAHAQSDSGSAWSFGNIWRSVMRQVNGVLDFTAQAIQAVSDAPSEFFDVESNDPPESAEDLANFNPTINTDTQLPGLPAPQLYSGTLIMNVPLQVSTNLSVGGVTQLSDLFVSGEFSIEDLDVPGVATINTLVAGGTQLGALTVTGNTQLNTLSVSGPVSFSNLTAGNLTVTNSLTALGGLTTEGADIDLEGGSIFAANIVNEVIAGDNISIEGTPNAPIISADFPSLGSRVRRLNGLGNTVTIVGGDDVFVSVSGSEIILDNTSDLSTVAARGGCSDCILDADVVDALTIASGTIDNTVIGSTTPAEGTFSSLRVSSAQAQLFYDTDNSNFVGFRASSSIGTDIVWTLPVTDGGVNQLLFTDGNGNLRFDDVSVLGVVNDLPDLGDVTLTAPAAGDVLSYDGVEWVNIATSSFGLGDGTFLGLSDTPSSYISNAVVVANAIGSSLVQSANFTFDGSNVVIGTATPVTALTVDGDVSLMGQSAVRFYEPSNGNYVGFQASTSLSGDVIWTLPEADGTGDQVLVTDGSGNLRFADVSAIGGGVSTYLELDDTPGVFLNNAIPYVATDTIAFSSNLTFDGDAGLFGIGTNAPTHELTVFGSVYFGQDASNPGLVYESADDELGIGTAAPVERLNVEDGSILQRGGRSGAVYTPQVIATIDVPDSTYEVFVVGTKAYIVSGSTGDDFHIVDISDRTAPAIIGSVNLPTTANGVYVSGKYAYVVTDVTGNDFHVIDISNPTDPVQVSSINLASSANGVKVQGRYAYVVTDNTGDDFHVIDIADPLNPVEVGSLDLPSDANDVEVRGNVAYVVTDAVTFGFFTIDITDPTNPVQVGTVNLPTQGNDVVLRGDYAFVVTEATGDDFHIIDVSSSSTPAVIGSLNLVTAATGVSVSGNYAYITTGGTGNDFHVIDISDLTAPVEIGSTELASGAGLDVQVVGRYAYAVTSITGDSFHVIDVTGVDAQSMLAHSLESGTLSVLGDVLAAGDVTLEESLRVGRGGIQTDGELLIQGNGNSVFTGNLGVGTTTPNRTLSVGGDLQLTGHLYDSTYSSGSDGMVLQRTANGTRWVATSSLGLGGGGGGPTFGSDNQIPFVNAGGTDFDYSASLTFDGSELVVTGDILPGANLTYDLGSSSSRFSNLWVENINIGTSTWSIFNGANGRLAFSNAAMQAGTEALSILSGGDIGIGTTSPQSKLHIYDATSAGFRIESQTGDALIDIYAADGIGDYGAITFYKNGVFTNQIYTGSADDGNLYIDTSASSSYVIFEGAGIGIGTTTPNRTLTVDGDMQLTGLLYDSTGSAGSIGQVLQRTASGLAWVATSSLGSGGGSSGGQGLQSVQTFTSGGTWTKPAGVDSVMVYVTGGGGGGGGADGSRGGSGGGGAGATVIEFIDVSATSSVNVIIGSGGSGGNNGNGGAGSASSFSTYATAGGGSGGLGPVTLDGAAGGAGGTVSVTGDVNIAGGSGGSGGNANDPSAPTREGKGGEGGASYWGGGGSGGPADGAAQSGSAGSAYGSGGGGSNGANTGADGGVGADGIVVVYEYTSQGGADLAELYPATDKSIGAGDLVFFDTEDPIVVAKAVEGTKKPLAGVVSTDPGVVLSDGSEGKNAQPVALAGRIPTKVNLEGGPIFPGDRIAPSSQPGVGRKANDFEPSVGTAITAFTGDAENNPGQMGLVTVFVDMQEGFSTDYLTEVLFDEDLNKTISNATGSTMSVFVPLNKDDTLWKRLRELAANFVDGVLSLIGLKTEFVETNKVQTAELCVDDVCVSAEDLRALLLTPETSEEVAEDESADNIDDNVDEEEDVELPTDAEPQLEEEEPEDVVEETETQSASSTTNINETATTTATSSDNVGESEEPTVDENEDVETGIDVTPEDEEISEENTAETSEEEQIEEVENKAIETPAEGSEVENTPQ